MATAPAATRAAVSRAEARSSTSRASTKSYFCMPARSAWPGRGVVSGLAVAPGAGDISSVHLPLPLAVADLDGDRRAERAAVADAAEDGDLVLLEAHAGAAPVARAGGGPARPAMSSTVTGSPAGRPSRITTRAWPWDSPAVRKRSIRPIYRSARRPLEAGCRGSSGCGQTARLTSQVLSR